MSDSNHPFNRPEFTLQKKRTKKSRIIIIASAILVLAIAGGVAYYYLQPKQNNANQKSVSDSEKTVQEALSVSNEIAVIAQTQGGEAAQSKIDEKISQADTKQKQAELYNLKIATLYSSNDPNAAVKALEYAYKIEEIYPNYGSALTIADLEYVAKNNTVALKYYELYMERSIDSNGESLDPAGKAFYERRIQELKV